MFEECLANPVVFCFTFKSTINVSNDLRFSDFILKMNTRKADREGGRERGRGGGGCGMSGGRAESDVCKSVTRAAAGDATACSCGGCRAEARWGWTRRGPCSR